jgi:phenylpropionate dioxygenase-like ring-hydroxylating dioxygenase large terminal subunit
MLKPEENERIARVGPGTPMGTTLRRYWHPMLLSRELPEPDCPPLRVRLLGEDLIAFRDTEGKVGLVDAFCPHRRAPMFFGRNEECGLRCVYHGWKFDRNGTCVDMPSEPPDSLFKTKVTIAAYPTHEAGDVIWTYMGPPELQPEPPDYEWLRAPSTHRHVSKTWEHCNWVQGLEGGLDSSHSSFLHNEDITGKKLLRNRDGHPRLEVERTDYGYTYQSIRNAGEDGQYVRVYQYIMPAQQVRGALVALAGGRADVPKFDGHIWTPIDDENHFVWNFMYSYDESSPITPQYAEECEVIFGRGKDDMIPGTFELKKNLANDYLIDRHRQKTLTYTGIVGANTQDMAVQEAMGPIVDRSLEHLGTSDRAIIAMRQLLLEACDVVEHGGAPRGSDPATSRSIRPHDGFVPKDRDWREAFAGELVAKW